MASRLRSRDLAVATWTRQGRTLSGRLRKPRVATIWLSRPRRPAPILAAHTASPAPPLHHLEGSDAVAVPGADTVRRPPPPLDPAVHAASTTTTRPSPPPSSMRAPACIDFTAPTSSTWPRPSSSSMMVASSALPPADSPTSHPRSREGPRLRYENRDVATVAPTACRRRPGTIYESARSRVTMSRRSPRRPSRRTTPPSPLG